MKAFWITSFVWIQVALAQINSPLPNGYGFRQNLPQNNLPVNQLPLNNGVPLSNAINRIPGNIPLNQVSNLPLNNLPNGLQGNLPINNGLQSLPVANRLPFPQQNLPINYGNPPSLPPTQNNYRNLPLGYLPNNLPLNNVPIDNVALNNLPFNNVPISNIALNNLPINNVPINNIALNSLPINNGPMNNLPIGSLPIGNNYQINSLPVPNNLRINNLQLPNNLNTLLNNYASSISQNRQSIPNLQLINNLPNNIQLINGLPASNIQIPNNVQIPVYNMAQLLNNVPIGNLPLGNNLISANYLQNNPISNNLPSINYNIPNNLPMVNYNLPLGNSNYLGNNLQTANGLNNLQLVVPSNNANSFYNTQISNVPNFAPNNIMRANVGQTLPVSLSPVSLGSQYLPGGQNVMSNPTNVNFGNDCGCKANSVFLLDDKVANALPSTPVFSLNGLQLGSLGKLPLFNGLPVIGMTESIVNLNSI